MLELCHVEKRYQDHKVLEDIDVILPDSGMIAIIGPSGCGKSTLLHILGGIDKDFTGDILYHHTSVKKNLAHYRKKHVSFIFQQLHLINWLSVYSNIQLSHFFHKQKVLSQKIDISSWKKKKIASLSQGQKQRIAFLRASYHYKDILLADEPTGSLDKENAKLLMSYLKEESKQRLVIIVSHDLQFIKEYSDEIYEMKDGRIINHIVYDTHLPTIHHDHIQKRLWLSHFYLALQSFRYYRKRIIQLIMGLSLSLICILMTLTMSQSLEEKIYQYVYSLIPTSSISIRASLQNPLSIDNINTMKLLDGVSRIQLFLDDYELLGIGFKEERYQESETLFISDDTSPYENLSLKYGHFPQEDHEILVSYSTAQHLCLEEDVQQLIGKRIKAWYKKGHEVKPIDYHVVGISSNKTTSDTIYQQENAYIRLLKERDHLDNVSCQLGILFVKDGYQCENVMKNLKYSFPQYRYTVTGSSTFKKMETTMNNIRIVLYLFSLLAIVSSLFLIGEVMFLNVIQKKKDFAIMVCFGAHIWDFFLYILCEIFLIGSFSIVVVWIIYIKLIQFMNQFFQTMLINDTLTLNIDYHLFFIMCFFAFGLIILSQIIPMIYMIKLNTVEALKG